MNSYCAFLRGINVGGNKKIPMQELKDALTTLGFVDVKTVLNSGNMIFLTEESNSQNIQKIIEQCIQSTFGFSSATIVRKTEDLEKLRDQHPFKNFENDTNRKLYITFIPTKTDHIKHSGDTDNFTVTHVSDTEVCSAIDMSKTGTIEIMNILEKHYGKRHYNQNLEYRNEVIKKYLKNIIDNCQILSYSYNKCTKK